MHVEAYMCVHMYAFIPSGGSLGSSWGLWIRGTVEFSNVCCRLYTFVVV